MTTVLIRRNAPTDSCHNLTALMSHCTKTFLLTPYYIYAHRNSDNLHNAVFVGYSTPYCGLTSAARTEHALSGYVIIVSWGVTSS